MATAVIDLSQMGQFDWGTVANITGNAAGATIQIGNTATNGFTMIARTGGVDTLTSAVIYPQTSSDGLTWNNITYANGTMTIPVTAQAPNFEIDPLGRPIISVVNQTIVLDRPFEQIETLTLDTNVDLKFIPTANRGLSPAVLSNIQPAAGGKAKGFNASDLAKVEPAAGEDDGSIAAAATGNGGVDCVNSFLDNNTCEEW